VALAPVPEVRLGRRARIVLATTAATVVAVGAGVAVERAVESFTAPVPQTGGQLGRRLFSASGNGRSDYWRIALGEAGDHPLLGGGAGSYAKRWLAHRPTAFEARDAHNLYLETLAELGPVGLALLLLALGVPLAALVRARSDPLAATAGAAYAAYVVHAALDWDWEIPAVTVPALLAAGAIVLSVRRGVERPLSRAAQAGGIAAVVAAVVFVFVMHAGNTALADAETALVRGDVARAADEARSARRWQPWAAQPWQRLAEAELAQGRAAAARADYREAIERDPDDWALWFGLAAASNGAERARAIERALELNPNSLDAQALRDQST
jgi:O-antigen ligase